jgi:SAM-dependent methyltransferase
MQHCPVCERGDTYVRARIKSKSYWHCRTCCAIFLDPAQRSDRPGELAHYRLHQNDVHDVEYRRFLSQLADPLTERLAPQRNGLDYGCGPGPALAEMLREAGHIVALYDPLFCDDRSVLGGRYDFITCSEAVEHFYSPAAEFRQLNQMLVPGGLLAVMTGFHTDAVSFESWHYVRDPTHVVFYSDQTFRWLAGVHGWECEFPCQNVVIARKK